MPPVRLLTLMMMSSASLFAATPKPNIVFILADDLGWADVAFHRGTAPTPNLDKLAREGDWKLIVQKGEGQKPGKAELFDLSKDPNETTDLARQMPARVASLRQMLADISKADRDAMVKE